MECEERVTEDSDTDGEGDAFEANFPQQRVSPSSGNKSRENTPLKTSPVNIVQKSGCLDANQCTLLTKPTITKKQSFKFSFTETVNPNTKDRPSAPFGRTSPQKELSKQGLLTVQQKCPKSFSISELIKKDKPLCHSVADSKETLQPATVNYTHSVNSSGPRPALRFHPTTQSPFSRTTQIIKPGSIQSTSDFSRRLGNSSNSISTERAGLLVIPTYESGLCFSKPYSPFMNFSSRSAGSTPLSSPHGNERKESQFSFGAHFAPKQVSLSSMQNSSIPSQIHSTQLAAALRNIDSLRSESKGQNAHEPSADSSSRNNLGQSASSPSKAFLKRQVDDGMERFVCFLRFPLSSYCGDQPFTNHYGFGQMQYSRKEPWLLFDRLFILFHSSGSSNYFMLHLQFTHSVPFCPYKF